MFLIFGTRVIRKKNGQSTIYNCPHCHNSNRFDLVTIRHWLCLYFIPLILFKTEHFEVCPICNLSRLISASELASLLESTNADIAYLTGHGHPASGTATPPDPKAPIPPV